MHLERTQSPCEVKLILRPQREATAPLWVSPSSSAAQRGKQPTAQGSPEVGCCNTGKMPRVLSSTRSVLNNRSWFWKARCRCFLPPFWCPPSTSRLLPVKTRFPGYNAGKLRLVKLRICSQEIFILDRLVQALGGVSRRSTPLVPPPGEEGLSLPAGPCPLPQAQLSGQHRAGARRPGRGSDASQAEGTALFRGPSWKSTSYF